MQTVEKQKSEDFEGYGEAHVFEILLALTKRVTENAADLKEMNFLDAKADKMRDTFWIGARNKLLGTLEKEISRTSG